MPSWGGDERRDIVKVDLARARSRKSCAGAVQPAEFVIFRIGQISDVVLVLLYDAGDWLVV